ncbi:hypothetical protein JCM21900_005245 [Sporobolomyces salmonicolor]
MLPTLDSDVLRIIIQHAASSALDLSEPFISWRWCQRARHLRHLALVNSQWRSLAQLELDRYLVVTASNYHLLLHAAQRGALTKRAKKVVTLRSGDSSDPRTLDSILEQCAEMQELESYGGIWSLNSLAGAKHLRSLTLHDVVLYGGHDDLVLPCRLSSVSLLSVRPFGQSDWKTLRSAGEGSLRQLCIGELPLAQVDCFFDTLLRWFQTVETLDLKSTNSFRNAMPLLNRCGKLVQLRLNAADLPRALPVLTRSLLSLELLMESSGSNRDERLRFLLATLGKFPLDNLERLEIKAGPVDERYFRSSLFHEVVEVANARGIEVVTNRAQGVLPGRW